MASKVLFFTAGPTPTSPELAAIAKLNAVSLPQYETIVANGAAINGNEFGADRLIPCDFVAGTIPEAYGEIEEIDPDEIPNTALLATEAIVSNAQVLTLSNGGTATLTIAGGVITAATYAAP